MSDWQVGDLAVCVDDGPCRCTGCIGVPTGLVEGKVYRVLGTKSVCQPSNPSHRWTNLLVAGAPGVPGHRPDGFLADRFRKIRPDSHEQCEPEFVTLLKRIKRKVVA